MNQCSGGVRRRLALGDLHILGLCDSDCHQLCENAETYPIFQVTESSIVKQQMAGAVQHGPWSAQGHRPNRA